MIDDSESKMLRAFCNLDVDKNGSLDMSKLKGAPPPTPLAASTPVHTVHHLCTTTPCATTTPALPCARQSWRFLLAQRRMPRAASGAIGQHSILHTKLCTQSSGAAE